MVVPLLTLDQDLGPTVSRIAEALLGGAVVLLPTDTVYGLVALPTCPEAIDHLFALKGRSTATPLAVLCAHQQQAASLAVVAVGAAMQAVGSRWWPGPLTLVVPRRPGVDLHLGEPSNTIGLRVPDHELMQAVARAVGPVAATSANPHGEPTATTAEAAAASLRTGIALIVDGGTLPGAASTVIDATGDPWRVLREGPIDGSTVLGIARASLSDGQ